ncbi:MAG: AAA family ATPase [Cyclobacteriaceae bacterium]|nr:AAA family ATPase [Cyclobacteriaceae bacterium]MCH8514851.1 AAA family ATPase [Cyclobacteriaceae bacterium]
MLKHKEYEIFNLIYEGPNSQVYLAQRRSDKLPVIFKKRNSAVESGFKSIEREFEIVKNLNKGGELICALEEIDNEIFLVRNYYDGDALSKQADALKEDLSLFFHVADRICADLFDIHQGRVIHKDLNKNNIIFHSETRKVKIIDFGISSLSDHISKKLNRNLEGTLEYISPEQSGRINRGIDQRSDIYSLGINFFEFLTGTVPFQGQDTLEVIHKHLTQIPHPPSYYNSNIPQVLDDLVMKCIAKRPEDRYQSISGLWADILSIKEFHQKDQFDESFQLGSFDSSSFLQISGKLYGREKVVKNLQSALRSVEKGGVEYCELSGPTGSGKSHLMAHFQDMLKMDARTCAAGSFEKEKVQEPFYGIQKACNQLIDQLLHLTESEINFHKMQIENLLGNSAVTFEAIAPNLSSLIDIPDVEIVVEGQDAVNQLRYQFKLFIQYFIEHFGSFVLCLEDIQYIDDSSSDILLYLLSDREIKNLLVVSTVSDKSQPIFSNKVFSDLVNRPSLFIDAHQIALSNWTLLETSQFLSDTLQEDESYIEPLAKIIFEKSGGNPFFTSQFLQDLNEKGLLVKDKKADSLFEKVKWSWNDKAILELPVLDSVVDLLLDKFSSLPENQQNILRAASVLNREFTLEDLSFVLPNHKLRDLTVLSKRLIDTGIIFLHQSEDFTSAQGTIDKDNIISFTHDNLQHAVYSKTDKKEISNYHFNYLEAFQNSGKSPSKGVLLVRHIESVDHVNLSRLQEDFLISCYGVAFKKFQKSRAYDLAYANSKRILGLISNSSLSIQEKKDFLLEHANIARLTADYEGMESALKAWEPYQSGLIDKAKRYELESKANLARGNFREILESNILNEFGIKLPRKASQFDVIKEFILTQIAVGKKTSQDLASIPDMKDEKLIYAIRCMQQQGLVAYFIDSNLLAVLLCRQLRIMLKHGQTKETAYCYASFGLLLAGINYDFKPAIQLAGAAEILLDKYKSPDQIARVNFVIQSFIYHWNSPMQNTVKVLLDNVKIGLKYGDTEHSAYSLSVGMTHLFFSGESLSNLKVKIDEYVELTKSINQSNTLHQLSNYRQLAQNLSDSHTAQPWIVDGKFLNKKDVVQRWEDNEDKTSLFTIHWNETLLSYLFDQNNLALRAAEKTNLYKDGLIGGYNIPMFFWVESLINFRAQEVTGKNRKLQKTINKNIKLFKKWCRFYDKNHYHKLLHLEAELDFYKGNHNAAMQKFNQAILKVEATSFTLDKLIIYRAIVNFYLDRGFKDFATFYLNKALDLAINWGAHRWVDYLCEIYKEILPVKGASGNSTFVSGTSSYTRTTGSGTLNESLDLKTIIKSNQSISGEVQLSGILKTTLSIIMESAGADSGYIYKQDAGKAYLWASIHSGEEAQVFDWQSQEPSQVQIVNFVNRSKKTVVIDDLKQDSQYSTDPYYKERMPASVFCLPVINKGNLLMTLYLENNLATGVFSNEREELLGILASQAAISTENASLYENLENKVKERTQEVVKQKEIIEKKNDNITASINYAKRIQDAIIPDAALIKDHLIDAFVLFRPRDIVSGDFYWFKKKDDYIIIAAVDCTGHGVPGAFMSMIGYNLLNDAVLQNNIFDPGKVLEFIHQGVRAALQQETTNNRDGMDMALIVYDQKMKKMTFAGANNPLVRINSLGEIERIQGDKSSIGGRQRENVRKFTTQTIEINPNDKFFIFSDGYQDQFGGANGRKYMSKRFRDLLAKHAQLPMDSMKLELEKELDSWMINEQQLDDILVIGLEL